MVCLAWLNFFSSLEDKYYRGLRSSNMAASTSRQPHDIPLPSSPDTNRKSEKKVAFQKGKGKGKEQLYQSPDDPAQAVNTSWDDVASDSGWEWASLTEPSASNVPPIFTKDGRYGQFLALFYITQYVGVTATSSPLPGRLSKFIRLPREALFRPFLCPRAMGQLHPSRVPSLTRTTRSN